MKLELIRLSPENKDRKYFEQINDEAFPLSERMSFDEILTLHQIQTQMCSEYMIMEIP